MAFNFPTNPALNEVYTSGDYSFVWNGLAWVTGGGIPNFSYLNAQLVSSGIQANSAFIQANSAFIHANAAFNAANSAADTWARNQANSSFQAANSSGSYANSAFIVANSSSIFANTPSYVANSAAVYANGAFARANNSLNANNGGTVTGDVIITGNLTVVGASVYANTETVLIKDNIITLNAAIDQSASPISNAGIEVDRGSLTNTSILWNETSDTWQFTNDGTLYRDIAPASSPIFTGSILNTGNIISYGFYAEKTNVITNSDGLTTNNTYKLTDGVVHYHTANSTANSTITLNGFTGIGVGNSIGMAVIVTNNATAKYITSIQIDGTTNNVSVKWSGGAAPIGGTASNTDIYSFSVIKTADPNTFVVFASQSKFGP